VLGVDWGRRAFLRRAIGALAGWIALRGWGIPESVRAHMGNKSPNPQSAGLTVEPVSPHAEALMLHRALLNPQVLQIEGALQARGFTARGSAEVLQVNRAKQWLRTVVLRRYIADDQAQEAILAYGEEATGAIWTYAIVAGQDRQRYALVVHPGGQVERLEAPAITQVDWDCLICNILCGGLCGVGCAAACVIICGPNIACTLICGGMCGGLCGGGCSFGCGRFC